VLERRQDAGGERGGAAVLDKLDQRVKIHAALAREVLGELGVEAGLAQSCATPGDNVGRCSDRPGLISSSKVHVSLAHPREPFLPFPTENSAPSHVSSCENADRVWLDQSTFAALGERALTRAR